MIGPRFEKKPAFESHTGQTRNIIMTKLLSRFYKDESGATAIEYGLIAALIAMAIIIGAGALGNTINQRFQDISDRMNDADTRGGLGN
jgi:pilus assembly protein Flp/PilA